MKPAPAALSALLEGTHADPFSLLGVHEGPAGLFARAVLPGAEVAVAFSLSGEELGALTRVDDRGLFEGTITGPRQPVKYRAGALGAEWWVSDPYSFGPVLGPMDDYLISEGTHHRLYDKLGAHLIEHEGASGVHFAVWAPHAALVSGPPMPHWSVWWAISTHGTRAATRCGAARTLACGRSSCPMWARAMPTSSASSGPMARRCR